MGIVESLVEALSEAVKKGAGRKNIVAIIAILLLSTMMEAPMWLCYLVAGVAGVAIFTQWILDMIEIWKTGKDQPDNGTVTSIGGGIVNEPDTNNS